MSKVGKNAANLNTALALLPEQSLFYTEGDSDIWKQKLNARVRTMLAVIVCMGRRLCTRICAKFLCIFN